LRKLGYNIQAMKVAAALTKGTAEVPADEGIRTTLRMGDSALIIGEIRSKEALALYEAMRVGALANIVAGTIHGDSPYGIFDRVVNDLQVPKTSFKATDIIVVANPVRSADGLHRWRRITQITEVRKHWENDPITEKGFVDLMKYDSKKDDLVMSDELINGDSEILKAIASNVKEWAGNWDAVWDNILLRAKTKETLVNLAEKTQDFSLLEAEFVIQSNDQFHKISESVKEEVGSLDSKRIFFEWNEWLKRHVKRLGFRSQL
ncbi:MAG TPA: ATPase, T2SS/T4P/T4SS family, partial [Candidatus Nanoarchaeia archaeon]|nr:ATPase, T2SS/T4P/T4SS family [Candidatus Nanoarchaeia archaeon]